MDNKSYKLDRLSEVSDSESVSRQEVDVRQSRSYSLASTTGGKIVLVVLGILAILCLVLIILLALEKNKGSKTKPTTVGQEGVLKYKYSDEATRVGLKEFLTKVQTTYFDYNRHSLAWQPDKSSEDLASDLRDKHLPYNNTPAFLKAKTDVSLALLRELESKGIDEDKLKPRELKVLEQLRHFLKTVFGSPFEENFYNGDWMLGPNNFCWQTMCLIGYSINSYAHYVKLRNIEELKKAIATIMLNRETILQYKSNMQLGVQTGMVREKVSCQSGLDAIKEQFIEIAKDNDPKDVLKEWFVKSYRDKKFTENITKDDQLNWTKENKKNITTSIQDALIEGIGKPLVELLNYIENEHIRHCLPQNLASGLANLPVNFVYLDGNQTSKRTSKTLPFTNEMLNGKTSYEKILPYFTTSDITPEKINEIGNERLRVLYPQVLEVVKNVTGEMNETAAETKFRKLLKEQTQYYNTAPFPANESNAAAHKNCTDRKSAQKNCPTRWASLLRWENTCRQVMGMLAPKLIPLFYHTGEKITIPNCPIEMLPSFNPSSAAQFFRGTGSSCTIPAYFGLPFFLENHGPRYSEWSVTAHEAWPGHHTQIQAQNEYFKDPYGGIPKWIDEQTQSTFFTEGWALYSENPVIAKDTDTYKNNPMQKYGMLKWQVWRALRLIVDTGLHYRGMNRSTALEYFSKYAWDESDLAQKEITRYQSVPGQATAYMLGQRKLVELRSYAKQELGEKFDIRDFHYQLLSQGSAPERYLDKHVKKYVKCTLNKLKSEQCDAILKSKKSSSTSGKTKDDGPPKPPTIHYA